MKNIKRDHAVVDQEMVDKFLAMEEVMSLSCVVGDAMERDNIMKSYMQMRSVNKKIIGPALTVKLTPGCIVDCLAIFDIARPGDVVVIDAFGESETSIWGGLMSGLSKAAGIRGVIIDGSARDTDEARMLEFPIISRYISPRAAHSAYTKMFEPIEINTPIVCGGISVRPGDLIVADEIGVVVVPKEDMEKVYLPAKEQAEKEEATRQEILKGATVQELLEKFGRI
jgi:regulator of RNase E activity RraA